MSQTKKWSAGTALAVVLLLVGGWFLLVAPTHAKASDLKLQTKTQEQSNDRLRVELATLKADAKAVPEIKGRIEQIRTLIPTDSQLPSLVRFLTDAARTSGVTLTSVSPSEPVSPPSAASTTLTPSAAPKAAASNLQQIPVTLVVSGTYAQAETFVHQLEGLQRSFLVTSFTVNAGSGATSPGAVQLSVNGLVFESTATAAAPATPGATSAGSSPTGPGTTGPTAAGPTTSAPGTSSGAPSGTVAPRNLVSPNAATVK